MSKRASNVHVRITASGEPTTIEKLCSDMCGSLESRRDDDQPEGGLSPASAMQWDQDQTAIQQIPTSAGHPPHQVVWAPWIRRAGTSWRGVARSFAQMGEAFGMRRSGIIACHVSFLASDTWCRTQA